MDFLCGYRSARDFQLFSDAFGQCDHFRVFLAFATFVDIETTSGFLTVAAQRVQLVADLVVAVIVGKSSAIRIADQEVNVDTGQIGHRQHAHAQVQIGEDLIDFGRRGAFEHQSMRFTVVRFEHPVTDKAKAHA
ncbi:hypothetical protein D3C85_992500 [compost metagenome]